MAEITDRITITENQYNYDKINQVNDFIIKRARMGIEKIDALRQKGMQLGSRNNKPAVVVQEKREEVGTMNVLDNVEYKDFSGEAYGQGKYYNAIKSSKVEMIKNSVRNILSPVEVSTVEENNNPSVVPSDEAVEVRDEVPVTTRIRKGGGNIKNFDEANKDYVDFLGNREDADRIKADTNEIFKRAGLSSDDSKVEIPAPVVEENKEVPRYSSSSVFEDKTPVVEPVQDKKEEKNDLVNKINNNDEIENEILQKARGDYNHSNSHQSMRMDKIEEYKMIKERLEKQKEQLNNFEKENNELEQKIATLSSETAEKEDAVSKYEDRLAERTRLMEGEFNSRKDAINKAEEKKNGLTNDIKGLENTNVNLDKVIESYREFFDREEEDTKTSGRSM